jgi:hypothetical protein
MREKIVSASRYIGYSGVEVGVIDLVSGEVARERDHESRPFSISCVRSWRTERWDLQATKGR